MVRKFLDDLQTAALEHFPALGEGEGLRIESDAVAGGTPPAIVNNLSAEIIGGTPKEFADHIQREIPKWAKVIKDAGVRLE